MKRAMVMSLAAMFGHVVLAQQPAVVRPPVAVSADAHAATNSTNPWVELRDVQMKLHPIEEKLTQNDPEIKALLQQRKDAEQVLQQLDKKRRELITAKLKADPAAAALVKRREELLAKAQEARSAGAAVPSGPIDLTNRLGVPPAPAKTP